MMENAIHLCPKSDGCSVPICPLDAKWRKRVNLREDATCSYLLESSKAGAEANFRERGRDKLLSCIREVTPQILSRHPRIRRAYERASLTGSRMNRVVSIRPINDKGTE